MHATTTQACCSILTRSLHVCIHLLSIQVFEEPTTKEREEIFMEAAVMAQIVHEHIVSLIGVVTTGLPVMIALQFCEHGSLEIFLRKTGPQLLLNAKMQASLWCWCMGRFRFSCLRV